MESTILDNHTNMLNPTAIALGFFDGIHLGHKHLINEMKNKAYKGNLTSCVLTFNQHPLNLTFPKYAPKLISSNEEKEKLFSTMDIDKLLFLNFNEEMMNYKPEDFVREILVTQLKAKYLIIGFNYNFGRKGTGTPDHLINLGKKYGFEVSIVKPFEVNKQIISSTFIRNLIVSGKVETVKKYLGRNFSITGIVVKGKELGKTYNIPTANIKIKNDRITPKPGVYYTSVEYNNKKYHGLTNVGYNPTFNNHPFSIETYILDFNEDIYHKQISVTFNKRIRDEKKFDCLDDLINQIRNDIALIRETYTR
ncbi:MAG: bifunctional riboflavin kinase/FAD synthetase [Eubacteriaceae bacterium]